MPLSALNMSREGKERIWDRQIFWKKDQGCQTPTQEAPSQSSLSESLLDMGGMGHNRRALPWEGCPSCLVPPSRGHSPQVPASSCHRSPRRKVVRGFKL